MYKYHVILKIMKCPQYHLSVVLKGSVLRCGARYLANTVQMLFQINDQRKESILHAFYIKWFFNNIQVWLQ